MNGKAPGGSTREVESAVVESSYIQPASTGLTMRAAACVSCRADKTRESEDSRKDANKIVHHLLQAMSKPPCPLRLLTANKHLC